MRIFFDEKEEYTEGNIGFVGWTATYDDMGNQTEISYYAADDSMLYGLRRIYDARGNLLEEFRCDENGKLAEGYLVSRWKYDEHDNCIERANYDGNNRLSINYEGYAKVTYAYNDRNQEIERRFYNTEGRLFILPSTGYAIVKYEYDNRGNNTKTSYFNVSERPINGSDKYATCIDEYDVMGRVIRQIYLDAQGNPTRPEDIEPENLYGYDKWGNRNYIAAADGAGNLINHPTLGVAIIRSEYDIRGNELSEVYYDKDDKPGLDKRSNVHKIEYVYDKQNRQTEVRYYGTNNKPCLNNQNNSHKIETKYDTQGNIIEQRYYDATVSLWKEGYAIEKYKYDERNRRIEYAMYDYLERPVNSNGYHRYVNYYDSSYEKTGIYYQTQYAANNAVVAEWSYNTNTQQRTRTDGWRQYWENSRRSLPATLNAYTRVTAISVSGNTCTVTMQINFSKYDISGADMLILENEAKAYAADRRKDSEMPRNTALVVLGVDNAGRDLYRISN